jgi:orotate phosphoribosyltransferase
MKPLILHPEGAALIARQILPEVRAMGGEYVGGLEMGAVPITAAVSNYSYEQGSPVFGFFVRKEAKSHGSRRVIEGLPKGQTLSGKKVVIVDDVTTTGTSALIAVDFCIAAGAQVVLVISVVDREEGAHEVFQERGLIFKALLSASEFLSR